MSSSGDTAKKYENDFASKKIFANISNRALGKKLSFSLFVIYPSITYSSIR